MLFFISLLYSVQPIMQIYHNTLRRNKYEIFVSSSYDCQIWMGGRTYNTGRGVLGLGRAALFLQMELSERSEFSICRNEISRQTQPLKLPSWRCGPPAHPNLTKETEKHKKILDYFRHLVLSYTVHYCGAIGLFVLPGNRWEKLVNNSA